MVLSMSRPFRDKKSGVYYFRKQVPEDLRPILGWEEKWSLRTKDPVEAKERHAAKAAEIAAKWKSIRSESVSLSHRHVLALSGMVYRELVEAVEDDPGPIGVWDQLLRIHKNADATGKLDQWLGPSVDRVLLKQGLKVDERSRERLLKEANFALIQAIEQKKREAGGDYRPDPNAGRFPEWRGVPTIKEGRPSETTMSGLVDGWWAEAKAAGRTLSTFESYRNTFRRFRDFLGHDKAQKVTPEDVIAYKDHRLREINPNTGKPISPKTIKDSDLAALKRVFKWAVSNRRLETNPAESVTVSVPKRINLRSKGFTDGEALLLLSAAWKLKRGREHITTFNAKKWVPWLCAYTGARVGEVVQLRVEDLREEGGVWVSLRNCTGEARGFW